MLKGQNSTSSLVDSQILTETSLSEKGESKAEEVITEEHPKLFATPIQIRLTKIPFGTRIRQLKDDLISLSCRPLNILWEVSKGSAVLVYSRKQYPKQEIQQLMERLKYLPYPAELLNPLENPGPQQQNLSSLPTPKSIKDRRQTNYRGLKKLSGRPSVKEMRQSQTPKKSQSQVLYQIVTPAEGEVVEAFSQLSLANDFPPLSEGTNKE